ncbi:MAG: hypothetical protein IJX80_04780 [Clostridia bacterium]|nr:hypothetical protein [Clostridia bacterium]
MKKNHLREIVGDKIRWQYFTGPLLILLFCMIFVPYCFFVFSFSTGEFNLSKWFSDLLVSIEVCLGFAIPFIILSLLNRRYFGKIICVINEYGIHYKNGMVKWEDITKIEYEIELPGGTVKKENLFCHAVIHTKKQKITLIHAPIFFISKVKKHKPSIDVGVSKNSKWIICFIIALLVIAVPIIPLFT